MVPFLYLIMIVLIIGGILLSRREKSVKVHSRKAMILGADGSTPSLDEPVDKREPLFKRLVEPKLKEFKRKFRRNMPADRQEKLELKLLRAGNPMGLAPFEYRIAQLILVVSLPLLFSMLSVLGNVSFGRGLFLVLLGLGMAFYLPVVYLKMKTAKRQTQAVKELPDFIDLLAVSMELDWALIRRSVRLWVNKRSTFY